MKKMTGDRPKRAFITGASEGIGRAFARKLADEGYAITAIARNSARLDSLLAELPSGDHRKLAADLSTRAGLDLALREITSTAQADGCQLLVNNAGFGGIGVFRDQPIESVREMIALNILAVVELCHAFLRSAKSGDGLINVSSTLSLVPMPIQPVYSATKSFVTAFTEALWFQNHQAGIRVLNLCPGATRSEFTSRAGGDSTQIPDAILETAEEVVAFALRSYALGAGPTVVSGWKNRFLVFLSRLAPRRQLTRIMGALRA